jgi:hypothetical protein
MKPEQNDMPDDRIYSIRLATAIFACCHVAAVIYVSSRMFDGLMAPTNSGDDTGLLFQVLFVVTLIPLPIVFAYLFGGMGMDGLVLLPFIMLLNSVLVSFIFRGILRLVFRPNKLRIVHEYCDRVEQGCLLSDVETWCCPWCGEATLDVKFHPAGSAFVLSCKKGHFNTTCDIEDPPGWWEEQVGGLWLD